MLSNTCQIIWKFSHTKQELPVLAASQNVNLTFFYIAQSKYIQDMPNHVWSSATSKNESSLEELILLSIKCVYKSRSSTSFFKGHMALNYSLVVYNTRDNCKFHVLTMP